MNYIFARQEIENLFELNESWRRVEYAHGMTQMQFADADRIFIILEYPWEHANYTDFFGFKILRFLRLNLKIKAPVILLSFLDKRWFLSNAKHPEFKVLNTPGHYFFQLPVDWSELEKTAFSEISDNTLHDINGAFFTLEGIIDEEFHNLKNRVFKNSDDYQTKAALFESVFAEVKNSFNRFEDYLDMHDHPIMQDILAKLKHDLEEKIIVQEDMDANAVIIDNYIGDIKRLLPPDEKHPEDIAIETTPAWKILFVDDDKSIALRVQELFADKNITCSIASNAQDVFDILRSDEENNITVLICDYRLLNADESWQEMQGYSIIEKVFLEFENELAFFSLTSFNKRTLIRVQNLHNVKVHSASKDDVIGKSKTVTGFNLFADKVLEEGNKVFNLKRSQPRASSWVKGYTKKFDRPLRDYYRKHRLANDLAAADQKMAEEAEAFFAAIVKHKHQGLNPEQINILPIQEGIGKDKKQLLTESEKLEKFRIKLIGRRIAIALHQLLEMDKGQIYSSMKSGRFRKQSPRENDNTINQFFSTFMALSLEKDIPDNLLPEEKKWLAQMKEKYG